MDNFEDPQQGIPAAEFQFEELMHFLQESRDMRQAAQSSLKQAMYAGSGAVAGGFLLGPVGGLVGGIAGSVYGFLQADDYDGFVLQLMKLPEGNQREVLVNQVGNVLRVAGATAQQFESVDAFRSALVEFAAQRQVRDQIWNACVESARSS